MASRVFIESDRAINPALLFKGLCEKNHIPLPSLRHILGILVAAKICPEHWKEIAARAYPNEARNFTLQLANDPGATSLTERPLDALHILGFAHLSPDANSSGVFKNFCSTIQQQPNTVSQMLFFASHMIESHPDAIWNSGFVLDSLNAHPTVMKTQVIPKIKKFISNVPQNVLHENYALLLSGLQFDYTRLDKRKLEAAEFPCQQPPKLVKDKALSYAELFGKVSEISDMLPIVDTTRANPDALATAADLINSVQPGKHKEFSKLDIQNGKEIAQKVIDHFSTVKFTEPQLRQRALTEFTTLRTKIAVLRTKINHRSLIASGNGSHANWSIPKITDATPINEIYSLISQLKTSVVILDQHKQ
jgi:hypothetical protein